MKKITFTFLAFMIFALDISAQTPQYYNYNTTNAGNTFPFGTVTGRMIQCLIRPGEINQPGPAISGNITKFFLMIATSFGPITYTNLSIQFRQDTITTLPSGVFYTGTKDTVYKRTSVSITGVQLNWLEFTLDHPFAYDSTKSLIIQIEQLGASASSLYNLGTTYLTGRRRTYSTPLPFTVQGQDAYVVNFGVNISPITGVNQIITSLPNDYKLEQNYPNPFNNTSNLKFQILNTGDVKLVVYDIMGREVQTLVNESLKPGTYEVTFDGTNFPSGIYFYKLSAGDFSETKKMLLLK